jgi:hypothetical protein
MGMMFTCYYHISFSYSALMYPHVLGLCTYVCTGRRVEDACTYMCFCVYVNSESGDSLS